ARALIERAKSDATAYDLAEGLTTEVGPRLGGTDAEARARDWAVRALKRLGFKNVRIEPYTMSSWRRGEENAAIVAPYSQRLVVAALGNSPATPEGGVVGEVARFGTLAELKAAPLTGFEGKIIFVDEPMTRTQDGSGYGVAVAKRSEATLEAAKRGAAAALIRSVGTDSTRFPHAGNMRLTDQRMAPAAALSAVDADLLASAIARAKQPVRVSLNLRPTREEQAPSGNVVGEITGRTNDIIVVGGHLDSWDLGSGALDDAAGVAITAAAAKLVVDLKGKPRRTIRVVFWGAEEVGLHGARAYAEAHKAEIGRHYAAAESDFGSGRVWKLDTRFGPDAALVSRALFDVLRPIGVGPGDNEAGGGADVGPLRDAGVPVFELNQDGSAYFDYHHTANDTLDKIDREDLAQNV
ncbi:MAG: M20/M25/M40 family metallo-hydrolase, partial [Parvularculaceae bacterium]|nr:M20/M25/M40 family metallo-hydrolase [Parvularculaceae bacterium]